MANISLLFFSFLVLCLTLVYLKWKWPDLDVIDIYIIFIAAHFGIYPFIRGLYFGKGVVYDSYNSNPLVIGLVFLHLILIVIIIRVASAYLPAKIKNYLGIKALIKQWASVNNLVVLAMYSLLIIFQFIAYWKYGIKSHILPNDFAKIGKDLPYWLTSMRTIYNFLVLGVFVVLISKAMMSEYRTRYFWMALIIIFIPFGAYFGRKNFANIVVMAGVIWLVKNEEKIFQFKNLKIVALMVLSFFLMSNCYETYRVNLMRVGGNFWSLSNPISAALNFNATVHNLGIRPGTWELNYLIFNEQTKGPGKITTDGKIIGEGLKGMIPRLFWPGKKFQITSEVLAEAYNAKVEDVSLGNNIFGVAQAEFGYFSIIIVPLTILLIIIMMAGLMKMTINYPTFLWLFSMNFLYFFINVEENQMEIFFLIRNIIAIMSVFLLYILSNKIFTGLRLRNIPIT